MKNKLFYGLFVIYAVMAVFILYINGVFTGEVTSFSNLVINGVFLAIIGFLFFLSAMSFFRLNRLTGELQEKAESLLEEYKEAGNKNLWAEIQDRKGFFEEENLRAAFGKYRLRVKNSRAGKRYLNPCDIEDYINEDLLDRVGSSYFNSGISGTLTGLGILGTFIGLSLGLGSFSGEDIYTISDNVGPLLSGMKVAFHTSVYGILFSLFFNFVYRGIMADAYEKLDQFLSVFRQCALPPTAGSGEDNMTAMLVYQANMANYLKELLALTKGEAADQTESLNRMARQFTAQLQNVMGTEFEKLGEALKTAQEVQLASSESGRRLMEAAKALVDSNNSMQQTMVEMMKRQERFAGELAEQRQTLNKVCEEISRDVSNQLYTFEQMRDLYEK